jgi:hypothetical protein
MFLYKNKVAGAFIVVAVVAVLAIALSVLFIYRRERNLM